MGNYDRKSPWKDRPIGNLIIGEKEKEKRKRELHLSRDQNLATDDIIHTRSPLDAKKATQP